MQKREAIDSDPGPPPSGALATPRVSGEQLTTAQTQAEGSPSAPPAPTESGAVSEPSDTLLSAGKPADRLEVMLEDRLASVDERLRDIDARLAILERKKSSATPEPRQKPWLWLAFLVALVVVFQVLARLR